MSKIEGFTPGPWRVSPEHNGTFIRSATGGLVASAEAGSQIMRDPDARLIAAAPDLLARVERLEGALRRLEAEVSAEDAESIGTVRESVKQARAALAEGKE